MPNAFVDPKIPSLEWLRDEIAQRYDLPRQKRMDMVSACNMTSRWVRKPLSMIPANAAFLRKEFEGLHHLQTGSTGRPVSKARLQNVKSLLWAAMREAGLSTKLLPYGAKKSPEWQRLFNLLDDRYLKTALSCFMGFCSNHGIAPDAVDDQVMSDYLRALETESPKKHPRSSHQTTCRTWNIAANTIPGWPKIKVTVPRYDNRQFAVSEDLFHPQLQQEIVTYLEFLEGNELFGGLKKGLKPTTIKSNGGDIRRYLSALHHSGYEVGTVRTLEEMVSFDLFKRAVGWLWDRNGKKPCKSIEGIAWTIRCIAVKHIGCDEETRREFTQAMSQLRVEQKGLSAKNRHTLQQFDDPKVVTKVLTCPDALWNLAKKQKGQKARLLVQSAILIEILIYAPLRIGNLRALRIDQHLSWVKGKIYINVPADEVKNGEALHYILPKSLTARIDEYIETWRSPYISEPNPYLFPGRNGGPKDETCLRRQIVRNLFDQTGVRLTPHQFRHFGAKLILDDYPGYYELVRKLLGHKGHSTAYENYSGTEMNAAYALYDGIVLKHKARNADTVDEGRAGIMPSMNPLNPAFVPKGRERP